VNTLKKIIVQPKSLILIFLVTSVIVVTSVLIELNQSKNEMLELMEQQGHSLLETVLKSSEIALYSYEKIEEEIKQRLLSSAFMIREMYERGFIENDFLEDIASKNQIFRINIFDKNGKKIFSNVQELHTGIPEKVNPVNYLSPIFEGAEDTLIIGMKPARYLEGQRFTVTVAAQNRSAIVLNIDAEELLDFRKQVGFGVLLKQVTENQNIEYAALQDDKGIIAASGDVAGLSSLQSMDIVTESLNENIYKWHIADNGGKEVFEIIHPFFYRGETIGMFRLGISLEPMNNIKERLTRRVISLGIVLLLFGFVTITLIFARQNFDLLSKKFKAIESYSSNILSNVSDTIIVLNEENRIITINNAGEKLLGSSEILLKGKNFYDFLENVDCAAIFKSTSSFEEIECVLNGITKVFLISKSKFTDENNNSNLILVLKDRTKQKALEKQLERKERLIAMGELASSVAHEIRNPLNSIGTITQQLGKDFAPKENEDEYKSLTKLVYKEVRRINETIQTFLKFAKPQPIKPERFILSGLIDQLEKQYSKLVEGKNSRLIVENHFNDYVSWDKTQITQVLINLMENALDAVNKNGIIKILVNEKDNSRVEIKIFDNGKGISREDMNRIFNLYFTTKEKGSGIGLSIVQKIISDHNGLITFESKVGEGTTFSLLIPTNYS